MNATDIKEKWGGWFAKPDRWVWNLPELSGWNGVIVQLLTRLEAMDVTIEIQQVKEKFGGLRFYASTEGEQSKNAQSLIAAAESACWWVCQSCGSTTGVTTGGDGWITTECGPCRLTRETDRLSEK